MGVDQCERSGEKYKKKEEEEVVVVVEELKEVVVEASISSLPELWGYQFLEMGIGTVNASASATVTMTVTVTVTEHETGSVSGKRSATTLPSSAKQRLPPSPHPRPYSTRGLSDQSSTVHDVELETKSAQGSAGGVDCNRHKVTHQYSRL